MDLAYKYADQNEVRRRVFETNGTRACIIIIHLLVGSGQLGVVIFSKRGGDNVSLYLVEEYDCGTVKRQENSSRRSPCRIVTNKPQES